MEEFFSEILNDVAYAKIYFLTFFTII